MMARSFLPLPPSIVVVILATLHSTLVNAQQKPSFVWGFTGEESTSTRLTECKPTTIFVNSTYYNDVTGVPPYYLVAFPPYGIPTKTNVGSDLKNLVWTVPYSPGTRVIIGMVDGNDNAGGIATQIFPVGASQGTKCHDPNPSSEVKMDVINKGALNTCGFLSVHIYGGQKPYTFIVAGTDTVRATANDTLGPNDDQYDFLNILRPGSQFVAAAIDANGVFSAATDLITTQGSSDTSCPGLFSKSGTYTPSKAGFPLPAIAGIVVGVAAIGGLIIWYIRRRQQQQGTQQSMDLLQGAPLSPRHHDGYTDSPHNHGITPFVVNDPEHQYNPYTDQNQQPPGGPNTHLSPNNGHAQLHGSYSGASSGGGSEPWSPTTTHGGRENSVIFTETGAGSSSTGVVGPYGTGSSTQALVVQHQDASDVLELPPAYKDNREPQAIPGAPPRTEQRRRKN